MDTKLPPHLVKILYAWLDGGHEKAIEIITKPCNGRIILELAKNGDACALYLACIYLKLQGDDEKSIDYLFESLDNNTLFEPAAVIVLAFSIIDGGRCWAFQKIVLQALEKSEYSATHTLLGVIYEKGCGGISVDPLKAISEYEKSFRLAQGVASAYDDFINVLLLGGDCSAQKVIEYYSGQSGGELKVIEICNQWLQQSDCALGFAKLMLANAYASIGKYQKAVEYYLCEENREYPFCYVMVVKMFLKGQIHLNNETAEAYARRAVELARCDVSGDAADIVMYQSYLSQVLECGGACSDSTNSDCQSIKLAYHG